MTLSSLLVKEDFELVTLLQDDRFLLPGRAPDESVILYCLYYVNLLTSPLLGIQHQALYMLSLNLPPPLVFNPEDLFYLFLCVPV